MTTAAEHMAATLLRLAGVERDEGNTLRAEIFEAAADLTGATCSTCGAPLLGAPDVEHPVVPVDGREVDKAPDINVHGSPLLLTPAQQPRKDEDARSARDNHEES